MASMEALKKRRTSVKAKITRIQTFVDGSEDVGLEALQIRLECLELAWEDYSRIHNDIIQCCLNGEEEAHEIDCSEIETKYCNLKADLCRRIKRLGDKQPPSNALSASGNVKLPRIELPVFSGNYLEWSSFKDLFTSVIHDNKTIGASQKLHYLKNSLSGEAAALLHSIEITDANYVEAWGLLNDRYQNNRQLVQCHLKALFSQNALNIESAAGLRKLLDTTSKHTRALNALGVPTEHWDHVLVYLLTEKLDVEARREWELSSSGNDYPKFEELKTYLEQRCRALEASGTKTKAGAPFHGLYKINARQGAKHLTSALHAVPQGDSQICCICKGSHTIYKCPEFSKLNDKEKLSNVRRHSLCFNCLRHGHSAQQCSSHSTCYRCGSKHHTLLHVDKVLESQRPGEGAGVTTAANHSSGQRPGSSGVNLSTALIKIKDCSGNWQGCRALLDSGSQASFVSEDCVQRLGLRRSKANVSIIGIGQFHSGTSRGMVDLEIASNTTNFKQVVNALIINKLTSYLPNKQLNVEQVAKDLNITMADDFSDHGAIGLDVILGADIFGDLLIDGRLPGQGKRPSLFNTQFGWVTTGKFTGNVQTQPTSIAVNFANTKLLDQLKSFWELEEIVPQKHWTPEEKACELHFAATHTRDSTGRYEVRLPFKEDGDALGASKQIAISRLHYLEKRLSWQPNNSKQYSDFMQEYLELGHMEPVPTEQSMEEPLKTNYLPHQFVLKPDSTTTRLRVVFDASAKTSSGASLNDRLLVGPKLQNDIWDILMRFRLHKVAFVADIEKMFRQIRVNVPDADFQRILWRSRPDEPIQEFRLTTVTYGTASAPYLATRVLQQLAIDEGEHFPMAKEAVLRDFYVDDLISGTDSIPRAMEMQSQLITMMKRAGFQLRKWSSNQSELLNSIPLENRETKPLFSPCLEDTVKTLGMHWSPVEDNFFFLLNIPDKGEMVNKRKVLSEISRLFDPLGWLAPVIIRTKIFIQRLWAAGLSWDEQLPNNLKRDWLAFRGELFKVQNIHIKRCVVDGEGSVYDLHGFCDASEGAYGAVVYLRVMHRSGRISVHLLCAKTKVAPLKQVSLPRLELCGAVLLAKLVHRVQSTLTLEVNAVCLWTDSAICLAWISGLPRNWKTFVANRVSEIQQLVPPNNWRHVSSKDNPADLASRGVQPSKLEDSSLWWSGPEWLSLEEADWPVNRAGDRVDSDIALERRAMGALVVTLEEKPFEIAKQYSSLDKLRRIVAWCYRFVRNSRVPKEQRIVGLLQTCELDHALKSCVKIAQAEEFKEVIQNLINGDVKHTHLSSLDPFLDSEGLLRVGGRLRNLKANYNRRFPILLPKHHHLTTLLVRQIHERHLHAGTQATLAAIQQKFWILNGRSVVRQLIHNCHICCRDRAVALKQQMGNLPPDRLIQNRPFLRCGVDFGGPFLIRPRTGRGARAVKVYLAVFVCFTTKAVHLEPVGDLTSQAFIAALRRFMARRGHCSDIYSDNATNFTRANHDLHQLQKLLRTKEANSQITGFLTSEGVNWHFIPPRAPHFGGLWEAAVKSMKTHFRRVVGQTTLTWEEFLTVANQIEACLNSRPISPLSSDPNDLEALTPGHFLIGHPLTSIPDPDLGETRLNYLTRWQMVQHMHRHFWKRWHTEYLSQLQQRPKWTKRSKNIEVGDLVLIKEDNTPPLHWVKGRVVETFPGKDNCIRVANVKTATGIFKRPIVKLCPLPQNAY